MTDKTKAPSAISERQLHKIDHRKCSNIVVNTAKYRYGDLMRCPHGKIMVNDGSMFLTIDRERAKRWSDLSLLEHGPLWWLRGRREMRRFERAQQTGEISAE